MADTSEKKFQQGVYSVQVAADATVRIDPELRNKKGQILPVHQVTLSPGFTLLDNPTDDADPNYGTFACQNKTTGAQTLTWAARYNPPVVGQVIQANLGSRGANPGPAGITWTVPPADEFELALVGPLANQDGAGVNNLTEVQTSNTVVQIDDTGSAQVANLPNAGVSLEGRQTNIVRLGTNGVQINPFAGQTINGQASFTLPEQMDSARLIYAGSNEWFTLPYIAPPQVFAWRDDYVVDYTVQPAQDFKGGGDGNYIIDGATYTIANTANASAFELGVNGIRIVPTAGVIASPTFSGPYAIFALSSLYSSLAIDRSVRVLFHFQMVGSPTTNFEALVTGLLANDLSGPEMTIWNGYAGGRVLGARGTSITGLSGSDSFLINTAWNVQGHHISANEQGHWVGLYNTEWPTMNKFAGTTSNPYQFRTGATALSGFFGAERNPGGGLTEIRLLGLKVQSRETFKPIEMTDI